jgi:hypothetical protein
MLTVPSGRKSSVTWTKVGSEMTLIVLKEDEDEDGLSTLERALRESIFLMEGMVRIVWVAFGSAGFGSDERASR